MKNKLTKLATGIYRGVFENIPSRSNEACITVHMTNAHDDGENVTTMLVYEHHEDTDVTTYECREDMIDDLTEQMKNQDVMDWQEGMKVLLMAVEDAVTEFERGK